MAHQGDGTLRTLLQTSKQPQLQVCSFLVAMLSFQTGRFSSRGILDAGFGLYREREMLEI